MLPAHLLRTRTERLTVEKPPGATYELPSDFVWGAASASHQVEGMDTASDWWRFERQPGRVKMFAEYPERARDYKSDHWRRFSDDIAMMHRDLGLRGYRFSIDWSRVEPEEGAFDRGVIEQYARHCADLRSRGIRPCVTLFHWSSPDWIWDHAREGETGWCNPAIVDRFGRFCEAVVPALAPHVDLFCTLNEPNIFLYGAFSEGILAPGLTRRDDDLVPILANLLRCHVRAYRAIKASSAAAQVGIAQHFHVFEAASRGALLAALVAAQAEHQFSWLIPDAIHTGKLSFRSRSGRVHRLAIDGLRGSADFTGVNYYERVGVRIPSIRKPLAFELLHDHHGTKEIWPRESFPAGLVDVLVTAHKRYGLPVYVTENGRAHPDDSERQRYLREHVDALAYAKMGLGCDVRGYFYWSLLDNQEWANGFLPRLGLYEVDYDTGERKLRGTGRLYASIIRGSSVK